ncbi:unnamed protein product [Rotaria sp. Silwood1]|nr:unnamed protein product [Rotaria sp. Silwood1]CAF1612644.1 unnamed protein product [Rotaria sp. Silwood1]CAF3742365.1 unnamed protein product [Rotaria sp. Silwood1]CAF4753553.1 unnamed protein product [Rotaria sp. Silwood1]
MSSYINDENNESSNDLLHPLIPVSSRIDSGYLTFSSSYITSPSRLSPSIVIYNQYDSPIQSPINPIIEKFYSTIDYENYITTRKYFDILTQLYHRNTYYLIDKIFKNLSNNDLYYCLYVCKQWNFILNDYYKRKRTNNVKRNLFNDTNNKNNSNEQSLIINNKLTSTPMQIITNTIHSKSIIPFNIEIINTENNSIPLQNQSNSIIEDNIHLTASTMTFRYGYLKYLHGPTIPKRCPLCGFVSIVDVNDQHGICTNPLCRNNFCQYCSGPYHPLSPCKTTTGPIKSPWHKRASISPIFSNKTRNNLRRLLIR